MLPSRCILLGSGNSVSEGISLGLSNYIEREVTFGINDAIKFFYCTAFTWGDWTAYTSRFELYKQHPLVIGRYDTHFTHKIEGSIPCPKHDNLILLPGSGKYHGTEGLTKGLYSAVLTGAFTLNLAIRLGFKKIFLLGFDCGTIGTQTHFYEGIPEAGVYCDYEGKPTCGVGKDEQGNYRTSFYNNEDNSINALWEPFKIEMDKVQIFNVSPESRITIFPKINYLQMFQRLNEDVIQVNQFEVQKEISQFLQPFNKVYL